MAGYALTQEERRGAAAELRHSALVLAGIYGRPLVEMARLRYRQTTPVEPDQPVLVEPNRWHHFRELAGPDTDQRTSGLGLPNVDTLYSVAWLDVSRAPSTLEVPGTAGRYYSLQLVDQWSNAFAYVGRRTTGTAPGRWRLAGPGPGAGPGESDFRSPTPWAWAFLRVQVAGHDDLAAVHRLQDGFGIEPAEEADRAAVFPVPDDAYSGGAYFDVLRRALAECAPPDADAGMRAWLAASGLLPEQPPGSAEERAVEDGAARAADGVVESLLSAGAGRRGWGGSLGVGAYGVDYLTRAAVARGGIGAAVPEEAYYPTTMTDAAGERLTGARRYTLTFPPGALPPVDAFWSISLYDSAAMRFAANPIDRYAISGTTPGLRHGADSSLVITIAHDEPGAAANWLPAPQGPFHLICRCYEPRPELLSGAYRLPDVVALRP